MAIRREPYEVPAYRATPIHYKSLELPLSSTAFDFRFSASYASRYNNCHGSANLPKALPGFVHPERNERGMKGEGTRLHEIFQEVVSGSGDLLWAAVLLEELAKVWGPERTKLLQGEKLYITWWFMKYKTMPPIEWAVLNKNLISYVPKNRDSEELVIQSVPPRRLEFLALAVRYVAKIISEMDSPEILVEMKVRAMWLMSEPNTTVDLIIRDKKTMHVLDLKMGDIEVSPIENEQLMYYGQTFRGDQEKMILHIMQRNFMDSWEVPLEKLDAWVAKVQQSELDIMDGDLTLTAGSHCTFCPANPISRGDRGNVFCPVMLQITFGDRDIRQADQDVIGDDLDD